MRVQIPRRGRHERSLHLPAGSPLWTPVGVHENDWRQVQRLEKGPYDANQKRAAGYSGKGGYSQITFTGTTALSAIRGTSLAVQWLRLSLPVMGV